MKLVTYNTQWCCGLDGVVSPKRIVDAARAMGDFDVLCLQEIAVNFPRLRGDAGGDQPAQIAQLLPGFEVFFAPAVDEWKGGSRRRFGNLVATRLPVARVDHHPLPYPPDPTAISMPRICANVTVIDPRFGPVRIMTTHLEYYSKTQRMAQANAVRDLHSQLSAVAQTPPQPCNDGTPFETRVHTTQAIVCGDFNFEPHEPEYAAVTQATAQGRLHDCWRILNGNAPHAPTFRMFDRTYGPEPVTSDFVFVSDGLAPHVKRLVIDSETKASDHQPVMVEFG